MNGKNVFKVAFAVLGSLSLRAVSSSQYNVTILNSLGASTTWGAGISGDSKVGQASSRAILWSGSSNTPIDLHPTEFTYSQATAISGNTQVGYASNTGADSIRALKWSGSASSVVNLHPSGFEQSLAYGAYADKQVGLGYSGGSYNAILWTGTAESAVNLHPSGFGSSFAYGISMNSQVGYGTLDGSTASRALLWSGSANSVVNLHPSFYSESSAYAVDGGTQGGWVRFLGGNLNAFLWKGSAESGVNLHPVGMTRSNVTGVSGDIQVGTASGPSTGEAFSNAFLWRGSASSAVNLHNYLPVGYKSSSAAGVNEFGQIVGFARDENFRELAVVWTPVPEPASLVAVGVGLLAYSRRKQTQNRTKA